MTSPPCHATQKVAAALDLLPEDVRESAVAYLIEQAEKFRLLKERIDEGVEDLEAARVSEWNFKEFLHRARTLPLK